MKSPESDTGSNSTKKRQWYYLLVLIVLGLAVHLLIPQITTLEHSWSVVKAMTWWAVGLAVTAQILSYLGNGYLLHSLLKIQDEDLSVGKGALIFVASQSIGLVAGGWVGGAAAIYGWLRQIKQDRNVALLAGAVPSLLNNFILLGAALIGTLYLLVVHDLTLVQMIDFGIVLLVLSLLGIGIALGLRYPRLAIQAAIWIDRKWAGLRKKPFEAGTVAHSVERFVAAWKSLARGRWLHPLLGGLANLVFDMLTLYFLFVAAGYTVTLETLLAGYGLPLLFGKMAFILPGGVGVVEGSMVALYDSLKVPNPISVVVILGYRFLSFWLPAALGFLAAAYLSQSRVARNK